MDNNNTVIASSSKVESSQPLGTGSGCSAQLIAVIRPRLRMRRSSLRALQGGGPGYCAGGRLVGVCHGAIVAGGGGGVAKDQVGQRLGSTQLLPTSLLRQGPRSTRITGSGLGSRVARVQGVVLCHVVSAAAIGQVGQALVAKVKERRGRLGGIHRTVQIASGQGQGLVHPLHQVPLATPVSEEAGLLARRGLGLTGRLDEAAEAARVQAVRGHTTPLSLLVLLVGLQRVVMKVMMMFPGSGQHHG